ncbi:MAG: hypothetical protein LBV12_05730 [Puniceicoccales bacterium]|nr:hypothetical protein [Puniceicoccales bacterium]
MSTVLGACYGADFDFRSSLYLPNLRRSMTGQCANGYSRQNGYAQQRL